MTPEEIAEAKNLCRLIDWEIECFDIELNIHWSSPIGFGIFWLGVRDGKLRVDVEGRTKQELKELVCRLIDEAESILPRATTSLKGE